MEILSGASSSTPRSIQMQSGDLQPSGPCWASPFPRSTELPLMTGQFEFLHHLLCARHAPQPAWFDPPEMGATVAPQWTSIQFAIFPAS